MSNEPVKPPQTIGIDSDSEGLYFYLGNLHVIMLIAAFLGLLLINIGLVALTILAYFYNYFQLLSIYAVALILQFFMIIGAHIVWTGLDYSQTILTQIMKKDKHSIKDELSEEIIKKIFPPVRKTLKRNISIDAKREVKDGKA